MHEELIGVIDENRVIKLGHRVIHHAAKGGQRARVTILVVLSNVILLVLNTPAPLIIFAFVLAESYKTDGVECRRCTETNTASGAVSLAIVHAVIENLSTGTVDLRRHWVKCWFGPTGPSSFLPILADLHPDPDSVTF